MSLGRFSLLKLFRTLGKVGYKMGLGKIVTIRNYYYRILRIISPKDCPLITVEPIDGLNLKMFIDLRSLIGQSLVEQGYWEKFETNILIDILKVMVKKSENIVFVDVGAHIGYYTCIAAKIIDKKGEVYAFEPEPFNYSLLMKNIYINNFKNVLPVNKAISDKKGKIKLFLSYEGGQHSIAHGQCCYSSVEVETITLDEFFKDKKIDIIKIDVEGAEPFVIRGGSKILRNVKCMFIEFSQSTLNYAGISPEDYLQSIENIGFETYFICRNERLVRLNKIHKDEIPDYCNLLCVNDEDIIKLLEKKYS